MRAIAKNILTVGLLFVTAAASAQHVQDIDEQMRFQIAWVIDHGVEVAKSLGQEHDIQKEGKPLKWRCDIYSFTLPKKLRHQLQEMIETFETSGRENPNCYGVNSMSETKGGDRVGHELTLMAGEDPKRFPSVTIGKDYTNFINLNILDAADSTKTHRFAYALEWREAQEGKTDVRYIVTYAKIPSATTSLTDQNWPLLNLGRANVRKFNGDTRIQWGDKDYPIQSIDSLIRNGIPLVFSQLKQQFLAGQNTEFNAISVYSLCKQAREHGFFGSDIPGVPNGNAELEQLRRGIAEMNVRATSSTVRNYLQMAALELEKIYFGDKYYMLKNQSTGARLGVSFDYNNHACTYRETVPQGIDDWGNTITADRVFRFRFIPIAVSDNYNADFNVVPHDCYIVTENMFALEDGSETSEGQWLIFRYLNKSNPYQEWTITEEGGALTIINKATGRCVDLAGGNAEEGAAVFSYTINGDDKTNANQKWLVKEAR